MFPTKSKQDVSADVVVGINKWCFANKERKYFAWRKHYRFTIHAHSLHASITNFINTIKVYPCRRVCNFSSRIFECTFYLPIETPRIPLDFSSYSRESWDYTRSNFKQHRIALAHAANQVWIFQTIPECIGLVWLPPSLPLSPSRVNYSPCGYRRARHERSKNVISAWPAVTKRCYITLVYWLGGFCRCITCHVEPTEFSQEPKAHVCIQGTVYVHIPHALLRIRAIAI